MREGGMERNARGRKGGPYEYSQLGAILVDSTEQESSAKRTTLYNTQECNVTSVYSRLLLLLALQLYTS